MLFRCQNISSAYYAIVPICLTKLHNCLKSGIIISSHTRCISIRKETQTTSDAFGLYCEI